MSTAEDRITRVERNYQDLRRAILMLSAGTLVAALVAIVAGRLASAVGLAVAAGVVVATLETRRAVGIDDVIRARRIEIVGADGTVRLCLGETAEGAGAISSYDASGNVVSASKPSARST